jgi:hypothetical protein
LIPARECVLDAALCEVGLSPQPLLPTRRLTDLKGDTVSRETLPTRALLACGGVASPLYVTVTMAQALTRDGFDLKHHRFTLLTTGTSAGSTRRTW